MLIATRHPVPSWAHAGRRGPRHHHADAAAGHRSEHTGRTAVAVADGVGDSSAAAFAATLAADHAVRVAALEHDAVAGVVAAGDLLRSAGDLATGDAALVVALAPTGGDRCWTVAWVGDCRAYAGDGRTVTAATRDHTLAAVMRDGGIAVNPRLEHVLSTSVRTARPAEVGVVRVDDPAALLLVSDGVHRVVAPGRLATVVGHGSAVDRAEWIVEEAAEAGTVDNATALVVDTGRGPRIPAQRCA